MGKRREYREIASVEEYLSTRSVSAPEKNRIRGDVGEFLSLLEESGRTWPSEEDYRTFREMRLHKDKTPRTVIDRIQRIRKYYEWRQTQGMMKAQATEILEGQAESEAEAVNTPKEETAGFVAATEESIAEDNKPRRGRKPKPENADRVQVSVYLDRDTYEGVKDIAAFSGQNISDIMARLAVIFVEDNASELERLRQTIRGANFRYAR